MKMKQREINQTRRMQANLARAYLTLAAEGRECSDGSVVYRGQGGLRIAEEAALVLIGRDIQVAADKHLPEWKTLIMGAP